MSGWRCAHQHKRTRSSQWANLRQQKFPKNINGYQRVVIWWCCCCFCKSSFSLAWVHLEPPLLKSSSLQLTLAVMAVTMAMMQLRLGGALSALNTESTAFFDVSAVKHMSQVDITETEFKVAKQFSLQNQTKPTGVDWTVQYILLSTTRIWWRCQVAWTRLAMWENSFSTLKNVFSDHRHVMLPTVKERPSWLSWPLRETWPENAQPSGKTQIFKGLMAFNVPYFVHCGILTLCGAYVKTCSFGCFGIRHGLVCWLLTENW